MIRLNRLGVLGWRVLLVGLLVGLVFGLTTHAQDYEEGEFEPIERPVVDDEEDDNTGGGDIQLELEADVDVVLDQNPDTPVEDSSVDNDNTIDVYLEDDNENTTEDEGYQEIEYYDGYTDAEGTARVSIEGELETIPQASTGNYAGWMLLGVGLLVVAGVASYKLIKGETRA